MGRLLPALFYFRIQVLLLQQTDDFHLLQRKQTTGILLSFQKKFCREACACRQLTSRDEPTTIGAESGPFFWGTEQRRFPRMKKENQRVALTRRLLKESLLRL
ncbi:MAG: hypothetical protein ACI4MJ_08555, partial [Aristaeellaceae bacterium]